MKNYTVLFVCWGNICRSPAAECIFHQLVEDANLSQFITCDSAGTLGYHNGEPPDARMTEAALKRNIPFFGKSRKVTQSDFSNFDLILAMDKKNLNDLQALKPNNSHAQIKMFGEFINQTNPPEIPDPYYGGEEGFETVLNMVEEGSRNLLKKLSEE